MPKMIHIVLMEDGRFGYEDEGIESKTEWLGLLEAAKALYITKHFAIDASPKSIVPAPPGLRILPPNGRS